MTFSKSNSSFSICQDFQHHNFFKPHQTIWKCQEYVTPTSCCYFVLNSALCIVVFHWCKLTLLYPNLSVFARMPACQKESQSTCLVNVICETNFELRKNEWVGAELGSTGSNTLWNSPSHRQSDLVQTPENVYRVACISLCCHGTPNTVTDTLSCRINLTQPQQYNRGASSAATAVNSRHWVSWFFEPSHPQGITSGLWHYVLSLFPKIWLPDSPKGHIRKPCKSIDYLLVV